MRAEALDDIVQRLAVAKYALEAQDERTATEAVDAALAVARKLISDERGVTMVRRRPAPC